MKALLLFTVTLVYAQGREISNEHTLKLGQSQNFESVNYPNDTEANLKQKWVFRTESSMKIKITCKDFRLFEMTPCGPYKVTFEDGSGEEEMCGVHFGYERFSSGDFLGITLWTGEWDRGFLKCVATAISTVPPPPPPSTKPPSNLWSFLNDTYEPVDSTEHGVTKGPKHHVTCTCGTSNKAQTRIFGGAETGINEFPFIAALTSSSDPRSQFCGGSIVTPRHIITAAHCTSGKQDRKIYVSVGEHNLLEANETPHQKVIGVEKIIDHPEYKRSTLLNDISILLLDEPIEFTDYVAPICLLKKPVDLTGQYIKIIGWGRSPVHKWGSPVLQKVDLKVLPKDTCAGLSPGLIPKGSPTQMCAYAPTKSACSGDSGGPLTWVDPDTNRYTLVGLVSFGIAECGTKTPRFSTDVQAYTDWIQQVIKETDPTVNTCSKLE